MYAKMYKKVDVTAFEGLDEPEDVNGYIGQTKFYRSIKKETPISETEFIEIIRSQPRIVFDSVMNTINEIDKDHNGYVTKTELEDILKLKYPEHFETRDLIPIIKRFSSLQNRILIDYKGFRDWIRLELKNT
jgi:Ca2+-binding EF-hand superfamily protein